MYIVIRSLWGRDIVPKETIIHPWSVKLFEGTREECEKYCK